MEATYEHSCVVDGRTVTFSWIGDAEVVTDRTYALAFTTDGLIVLVADAEGPACWLPGGGIEPGEDEVRALHRELLEEADATIVDLERIGTQRCEGADGEVSFQAMYWCKVEVPPGVYVPRLEVGRRHLVEPEAFLDTLDWGRTDPKAPMLLERALEIERRRGS